MKQAVDALVNMYIKIDICARTYVNCTHICMRSLYVCSFY